MIPCDIGIITAPRQLPTLNISVKSLRSTGVKNRLLICAEPGPLSIDDHNYIIQSNEERLGCFRNFHNCLTRLLELDNDYLLVLSDDIIYHSRLPYYLMEIIDNGYIDGYHALFTHAGQPHIISHPYWNEIEVGWGAWCGLYVMRKSVVREMIDTEFYQNHLNNYTKNEQIDACVSECMRLMKRKMFCHNPSLSYTIGYSSTLNHNQITDGLNFQL